VEEVARLRADGRSRLGSLAEQAFLAAGVALYAGEGSKRDGNTMFANTNPEMVAFFCRWLRTFFEIDETKLTARIYLHEGLDLDEAERFWSEVTAMPRVQFRKPFRPVADSSIRSAKLRHGCVYVRYGSVAVHRRIMGLMAGLLGS
jgi:hypothetical protein